MSTFSHLGSGEVFGTGFLADAVRDTLYRYKKRERLSSNNRRALKSALTFLENIYKGYLLALPRSKVREEMVQQIPPYDTEYTAAFSYAVDAWSALDLPLTNKTIEGRIKLYRSMLKDMLDDAECKRPLEDIDESRLLEVQRFFSKVSELTLKQIEQQAIWSPFLHSIEIRRLGEQSWTTSPI